MVLALDLALDLAFRVGLVFGAWEPGFFGYFFILEKAFLIVRNIYCFYLFLMLSRLLSHGLLSLVLSCVFHLSYILLYIFSLSPFHLSILSILSPSSISRLLFLYPFDLVLLT